MGTYRYDIQDITEAVDVVEYIARYIELEEKNGEYFGLCPFHKDINPSFSITPETQLWYCFGCHTGGTVIDFVKKYNRCSYFEAIETLAKYANIDADTNLVQPRHLNTAKVMRQFTIQNTKEKAATYKVLPDDVMQRYEDVGVEGDIWRNEGIGNEVMQRYQVRYDRYANRLVFPIRNPQGQIISISGRTLDPNWKEKGLRKYNYYTSLGRMDTLFGLYENRDMISQHHEVIVFEGAKSVFKAEQWGYGNAVASLTSRINQYQMKLLINLGCRVVIAFDSEVNIQSLDFIKTLRHFLPIEAVINRDHLLPDKASPVDATKEIWEYLYKNRVVL